MESKLPIITIIGTTASGKTSLAVQLANTLNGEIISADSRQVYCRMNIGTGKDLEEYTLSNGKKIPYHLIDIAEPGAFYNLHSWLNAFEISLENIYIREKCPILCGGTGLYLESALEKRKLSLAPKNTILREELKDLSHQDLLSLLKRYSSLPNFDTSSYRRTLRAVEIASYYYKNENINLLKNLYETKQKKTHSYIIFLIDLPVELRRKRIAERLKKRLNEGMIGEIEALLREGISKDILISYGLEYRFLTLYLIGEMTLNEAVEKLEIAICQFAKRQMTWFRGMERRGFTLHRIDGTLSNEERYKKALSIIKEKFHLELL